MASGIGSVLGCYKAVPHVLIFRIGLNVRKEHKTLYSTLNQVCSLGFEV